MGRVYLAEDPVLQRSLAVKVIAVEKHLDDTIRKEYLKRFIVEARLSAKLNHPSIVTVHDAGEEHGLPWIAFDMVPVYMLDLKHGGSMKTRINAAEKLGASGDDRAIAPLTEAKEKGFRDPFVATTAASMLEKYFNK
jgi:serine/threonine protein kinase